MTTAVLVLVPDNGNIFVIDSNDGTIICRWEEAVLSPPLIAVLYVWRMTTCFAKFSLSAKVNFVVRIACATFAFGHSIMNLTASAMRLLTHLPLPDMLAKTLGQWESKIC
jgi:hypothetical protein